MSKLRDKIGITIQKDINDKLENNSINKSKLINTLLSDWLISKNNIENFIKKSDLSDFLLFS